VHVRGACCLALFAVLSGSHPHASRRSSLECQSERTRSHEAHPLAAHRALISPVTRRSSDERRDQESSEDIDQDIDEERDEACATPVCSAQIDVHEKNPLKNGVKTRKDSHEGAQRL
jgi:hypothetical protein